MNTKQKSKWFLISAPLIVLIFTKIGAEICSNILDPKTSWIPAFLIYYLLIAIVITITVKKYSIPFKSIFTLSLKPFPKIKLFVFGVIIPALIPLNVFIMKAPSVPYEFFIYILIFSVINPLFEEGLWRGLLAQIQTKKVFIILYSAGLFAFSHYFFWDFWFRIPIITLTSVVATFIMGILWMWFILKKQNLIYTIISHFFVDVFNLSIAIYSGIIPFDLF